MNHFYKYCLIGQFFIFYQAVLQAQNPAVNITTFKNGALGAYNLIHDDFGDMAVPGIQNYADTMAFNRGLKITFGAITASCEGNPGMYAKAQSMIYEHHHEIINHSHTHSCAVTNEACGGTGPNYGWAVAGATQRLNIEVDQSTQSIFTNTGIRPRFFIYPYDQYTAASEAHLQAQGYIGSRTGAYNAASPNNLAPNAAGFFKAPLVVDVGAVDGQAVAQNLNYWIDQAISTNQWVNRELHNVGSSGWGHVTVNNYRNHLNYVKQKVDAGELWVGTVSEILTYQIQKLNYTPASSWNNSTKTITVSWNTPAFNVATYLQNLYYKSPVTLRVNVSNAVHAGNYEISQNNLVVNDYQKKGNFLFINVYPHEGPVQIKVTNCATLCINTPPENTTVLEQTPLQLSVLATGLSPITYQWYKNGTLLSGQTSAVLTRAAAELSDAGNYHVVVTNPSGTLTSAQAQVTVTPNPCLRLCITSPPQPASTNVGQSFTLTVQTQGINPMTYQWYRNGTLIPGATSSSYTRASAVAADAGSYTVAITNSTGNVTSAAAVVQIHNQTPFTGTAIAIPGIVQAENFDNGGQNVSYYDTTPDNQGNATGYRTTEVDLETTNDEGTAGYNVGYMTDGEWLEYTVNVAATANYNFRFRTASNSATNGALRIEMDGNAVLTLAAVPGTGSWTTFGNVSVNEIPLTAGIHVMRIFMQTGNFNLNYVDVTLSSKLPPAITFTNVTRTYGDQPFQVAATSTSSGAFTYSLISAVPAGIVTVSATGSVTILGAGTAQVQVVQSATGMYAEGAKTMTLSINKRTLTLRADNKLMTYGATVPALTYTAEGFVNGDNATVLAPAPSVSTTGLSTSNAGSYPISISAAQAANYEFTYVNATLTINKRTLTLRADNKAMTYGATVPALTYTAEGFVNGNTTTVLVPAPSLNTTGLSTSNAGSYPISISGAQATNYDFTYVNATLTINKRTLTLRADNKAMTYGATVPALTYTTEGFVNGDNATLLVPAPSLSTNALSSSNAGSYPINISGGQATNYEFTYIGATLTINKRTLTLRADNKAMTYGATVPALTYTAEGFVNGDNTTLLVPAPSLSTNALSTSNAGNYMITITGGQADNYTLTYVSGTLTINRAIRTLTTTLPPTAYVGYPDEIVYSLAPNVGAVNASLSTQPGTAIISGTQLQYQTTGMIVLHLTAPVTTNYEAVSIMHVIYILPPQVPQISFANLNRTYGDLPVQLSASSSHAAPMSYSLVTESPSGIVTLSGNQLQILGAGIVSVKVSQPAQKGYEAAEATATLTIQKAPLEVRVQDESRPEGQENPDWTLIYAGLVNDDMVSSIVPSPVAHTSAVVSSLPGDYPIEITCTEHPNYELNCIGGTLTVELITALKPSMDNALEIFPNPSEHTVHVKTNQLIERIEVLSSLGVEVMRSQDTTLNLSALQAGVYLFRIHTVSGEVAIRSVIKR